MNNGTMKRMLHHRYLGNQARHLVAIELIGVFSVNVDVRHNE